MKSYLLKYSLAMAAALAVCASFGQTDEAMKEYLIDEIVVDASPKRRMGIDGTAVTAINPRRLRNESISDIGDLSLITPNLHIPDYGSKMTSTIYVRGMGARIDQPSMGLYVDDIPYLNKNNYDFGFFDIIGVEILRGPQSTLYGRNTIGGVIHIHTLSPMDYQGTRIEGSFGSANTAGGKVSVYKRASERLGLSAAVSLNRTDGFFTNAYDGTLCDDGKEGAARVRAVWRPDEVWQIDNTLSVNRVVQGGFAYAPFDGQSLMDSPIAHNDPCGYRRTNIVEGLSVTRRGGSVDFSSTTSYCYTDDCMTLDQDFSTKPVFTLRQAQKEHSASQDFVISSNGGGRWEWLAGAFLFYRNNRMSAPVNFLRTGIDELILENVNRGIQTVFPDQNILIGNDSFVIDSRFTIPAFGAALYHQSVWTLGRVKLTAGVRVDYESTRMRYSNNASLDYRFTMTMPQYKRLDTKLSGREVLTCKELMPRFAADWSLRNGNVYASVSKGYKAGGFNTQIFSDMVQNRMMNDMMGALGVYIDGSGTVAYDSAAATTYKPEYNWNYEVGGNFSSSDSRWHVQAALFYIDCRDQQLTVFPAGKSTGRMMSNAGRTRSFGTELSAVYSAGGLTVNGSYGYTDARFRRYVSGNADYAGRYLPHVPQNTLSVSADWRIECGGMIDRVVLHADWRGLGRIYWNEENTLWQDFYSQTGASVRADMGCVSVSLWGHNLTDEKFNTFYFKSIGNSFVQRGKPRRMGITFNINI